MSMPSEMFADRIKESLAGGERFEDFAYLFDTLVLLRRPYHQDLKLSEEVAGRILCVIVPDKPPKYIDAMQEFRLCFIHVSTEPRLQAEFSNCVRSAALKVRNPKEIVWTPSVYFRTERHLKKWF
jgi:hypothetical protein